MAKKKDIIAELDAHDTYLILRRLANEDEAIQRLIEELAYEHLSEVDSDMVTEELFSALEYIEVEDLWDQSGATRYGYIDPYDRAWEMFEEALEPFVTDMKRYHALEMWTDAKRYCIGILRGIYRFEKHASTEFAEWAEDAPAHFFEDVLEMWKKAHRDRDDIDAVETLVQEEFQF